MDDGGVFVSDSIYPEITGTAGAVSDADDEHVVIVTITVPKADPADNVVYVFEGLVPELGGAWSVTSPLPIPEGTWNLEVVQRDKAGNESSADSGTISVLTTPGEPPSFTLIPGVTFVEEPVLITGTGLPDATITLTGDHDADGVTEVENTVATSGTAVSVTLSADGNTAYIADSDSGLQIIDITDPALPSTTNVPTAGTAVSVVLSDDENTAYVADSDGGLQIIDITDPALPSTTNVPTAGTAVSVVLSDDENTSYVADSDGGLQIIDITDPALPSTTNVPTTGTAVSVFVSEDPVAGTTTAYVADSAGGLQIIDISDPAFPTTNVPTAGTAVSVVLSTDENTAYVADSAGGLQIIDITNPALPVTTTVATPGTARSVVLSTDGNTAYVADSAGGLQIIDITDPEAPVTTTVATAGTAISVTLLNDESKAFVADSDGGLQIFLLATANINLGTTTVDATGNWEIPVSDFEDSAVGDAIIRVTQTDAAGNVSTERATTISLDLTAAPADLLFDTLNSTNDQTPVISGTGHPGRTITLSADINLDGQFSRGWVGGR